MNLKNKLCSVLWIAGVVQPALAVMPVYDAPLSAQNHTHFLENLHQWNEKVKQYQEEIKTAKSQLKAITGTRDVANALDELNSLKNSVKQLEEEIINPNGLLEGGLSNLDSKTRSIIKKYDLDRDCRADKGNFRKLCEARLKNELGNVTQQQRSAKEFTKIVQKLAELSKAAKHSKDLKTTQDIANQIAATTGLLQAQEAQERRIKDNYQRNLDLLSKRKSLLFQEESKKMSQKAQDFLHGKRKRID